MALYCRWSAISWTCLSYGKNYLGAGEMAQQLRILTALPEVLSSVPGNTWWLIVIYNGT